MCGLITFNSKNINPKIESSILLGLARMQARGPDAEGVWQDDSLILGHRRLAILDLDSRAGQPMFSPCKRYVLVFNGEIYNFQDLKITLQTDGVLFNTESDSEVILALFARHGEAMLPMLRGMFALVIWDTQEKRGFAARDPYGIKPLYYAQTEDGLWFASQVKALLATGQVSDAPCSQGQSGFLLLGSVPEPYTWYAAIKALPAGHCVHFACGEFLQEPNQWWDIAKDFNAPATKLRTEAELRAEVRSALLESVRAHLVSDVPVGVFLSGGIDSGALAGLMREAGATNLHGITVAFREFADTAEDEAPIAAQIAKHYGIKHHIRWVSKDEFQQDLPKILDAMDQPSIDGINTWFASKAVAELGLKVVVSGVGGDELFQGYSNFDRIPKLHRTIGYAARVPGALAFLRLLFTWYAKKTGNSRWAITTDFAQSIPGAWFLSHGVFAPSELPALMGDAGAQDFKPLPWINKAAGNMPKDPRLAVSQMESSFYMRNQLLRDSDWASMAHSVELRTPLVDTHLLRRLSPLLSQFRDFPNKSLLSGAVRPALPKAVIDKTKTGFSIPMGSWLNSSSISQNGASSRLWAKHVYKSSVGSKS